MISADSEHEQEEKWHTPNAETSDLLIIEGILITSVAWVCIAREGNPKLGHPYIKYPKTGIECLGDF